ncbi:MAG: hypothetical protein RLZZ303_3544 [Candidatus Hydrogenedentota bacterium]
MLWRLLATLILLLACLWPAHAAGRSHLGDLDNDHAISLHELLRMIQLYNFGEYYCAQDSEDGYGFQEGGRDCGEHSADYLAPVWSITLSELLRQIQLFSAGGFGCSEVSEDGFVPGGAGGCIETQDIIINEFLTVNDSSIADEDGSREDWIELYNPNDFAVSLAGWSLTDSEDNPREWLFPDVSIAADGYLVVFASDKDRNPVNGSPLHTNFKLTSNGEYLALFTDEEPPRAATAFIPGFPPQEDDISYGRLPGSSSYGVLGTPTPGAANTLDELALPRADPPLVSPERGFYSSTLTVTLTPPAGGGIIRYTLDGSAPALDHGVEYSVPIVISATTVLRAALFREGFRRSDVVTHTYQFDDPTAFAPLHALLISGDEAKDLYEPDGIMAIVGGEHAANGHWSAVAPGDYNNGLMNGRDYEREVSVEYIVPGGEHSQLNAGVRVHGSPVSRIARTRGDDWATCDCGPGQPPHCVPGWTSFNKYSLKLYFRNEYGTPWMPNEVIPHTTVTRLAHLVLRGGSGPCDRFLNDEFARRLHADMGQVTATGEIIGLFINGAYKGHFNATLRLREEFFQEAYSSSEGWDVIEEFEEVTEGDGVAWKAMMDYALQNDLSDDGHYAQLGTQLDLTAFADYLLIQLYTGNVDWPFNNWTAARERSERSLFRFYTWDMEAAFGNVGVSNFTTSLRGGGLNGEESPVARLYRAVRANAQFRELVAQRAAHHLSDAGALGANNMMARYEELRARMAGVLPGISTFIRDEWIPQRKAILLEQLVAEGLYLPSP